MPSRDGRTTMVVVNPNSANGRTGKSWPKVEEVLSSCLGEFDYRFTSGPADATGITADALDSGYTRIVVVGGDGTNNEVVNGWFGPDGRPRNPQAVLGLVPRGTGGDFRKTFGIGTRPESWARVLSGNNVAEIDCGLATFEGPAGRTSRYFVNITSFGLGGLVDDRVNNSTKVLGGTVSFAIGTLRALWRWRNQKVQLKVLGPEGESVFDGEQRIVNVAVANGQYFGGGMWVAPGASCYDGLFDVVVLGDLTKAQVVLKTSSIYRGTHLRLDEVSVVRGSRVEASSDERVLIDMDGEQPGWLPATLEVVPASIRLLVPEEWKRKRQGR
ncbi:MAG: diacylglycerol kinase family lipid kinase [Deltaproteobacteria bacterium]|nr:MAG: diacylglycerol kinase family lipid kinase [Deltaproteobacteria bacterium]